MARSKKRNALTENDFEAIAAKVPIRRDADPAQLLKDIRAAASWFVLRAELQEQSPVKRRNTLDVLYAKVTAASEALKDASSQI